VEHHLPELAALEAVDVGRPISEPLHAELPLVVETLRHFAGWADKITGTTFDLPPLDGAERFSYTRREPLGVIGTITPWNAPTMIAMWKIAPALAAGNSVVLKPAAEAPLTALALGKLALEAGLPAGVLNVIPGRGAVAGARLARHPLIDKISFTGSTAVGREIAAASGENLTKLTLELGGKNPQIVWPDADLDALVPIAALSAFANQGQTCASGSRIYVHRSVLSDFSQRVATHAQALRLGDPLDPETEVGSLNNEKQLRRVLHYIQIAKDEGATLVTGGSQVGSKGYFIEPTVFVGGNDLTIAREEIFGPVSILIPFDDDDEVLTMANNSEYGLTAVLWTDSASRIQRFVRELEVGVVWVNAWGPPHPSLPWHGTKGSGIGEELGRAGLEAVTKTKTVNQLSIQ
jgi:betaine-aldehyde dehydrogenase